MLKPNIMELNAWLKDIKKTPLKPTQKLAIIREFVIPKLAYFLLGLQAVAGQIKTADLMIKAAVKHVLHMHINTPEPALYASLKAGGLDFLEFRMSVPVITRKSIQNFITRTEDITLSAAIHRLIIQALLKRLKRLYGPTTL